MAQYKLIYFNSRGRAEISRLLLEAAGKQYDEFRFEVSDWPKIKPTTPFGQVPILEIKEGGKVLTLSQSLTIARYLAEKFGFAGKTDLERAEISMYGDQINDLINEFAKPLHEKDSEKRKLLQEKLTNEIFPSYMKIFETKLIKENTGFFVGNSLSWADLYLIVVLEALGDKKQFILEKFPHIKVLNQRISDQPFYATYLTKRPLTSRTENH